MLLIIVADLVYIGDCYEDIVEFVDDVLVDDLLSDNSQRKVYYVAIIGLSSSLRGSK